ncbi:MAG: trypsin-like peptidase domain-containing protein [Prevotellaceae bacterium]|nr:trypsin-like peptidase domain-containing protein [Prevotellaceae bacterium]
MKKMQSFDVAKLLKEDRQNEEMKDVPFRFGYGFDVDYTLKDGVWETQDDNNIWSLKISSKGAYSLNFIFEELYLSEGAGLYIFSVDGSMVYGPVIKEQNISGQNFLSDIIVGDEVILQLIEPTSSTERSFLRITKIIHGYKNMFASLTDDDNITQSLGASASCNNDVACYSAWANESNAVAMVLLSNGTEWCTGSLLNNTNQNYKPYFLSAFHCIDSNNDGTLSATEKTNSQNWAFRFNYKKSTCSGSTVTSYITYNNANFRAAWVNTDFLLMELTGTPVAGLTFLGWDKTGNNPTSGTCIHHPKGDVMKISFDNHTITSNTSSITWQGSSFISPVNTHWVVGFDNGTAEGGSSGSPLFNQNKLVVGQLHGGGNGCAPITKYYGQFHKSWTGGGTDDTGLSHWLDPRYSGESSIGTINYTNLTISGNTNPYSIQQVTYTIPDLPTGTTVTWSGSSNLNIISGQGTSQVTISVCGGYTATLTATLLGTVNQVLTKNLNVNNGELIITPGVSHSATFEYVHPYATCYDWGIGSGLTSLVVDSDTAICTDFNSANIVPLRGSIGGFAAVRARLDDYCYTPWKGAFVGSMGLNSIDNIFSSYSAAYPNPASNELIIDRIEENGTETTAINTQSAKVKSSNITVLLYSHSTAQLVYNKTHSSSTQQIRIDTSKLPNGIYYLNIIENGEKIKEQTIIVNH